MKKIFLFCGLIFACTGVTNVFAACNSPITLGYDGNQEVDDDEFLYYDETEHSKAVAGYTNTGEQTSGDGKGYECDKNNSASCTGGDTITLPAGHYFNGNKVSVQTEYVCVAPFVGNDRWEKKSSYGCFPKGYDPLNVGGAHTGLTLENCSGYTNTDATNGTEFKLVCEEPGPSLKCIATACNGDLVVNSAGVCVSKVEKCKADNNCGTNNTCNVCCATNGTTWDKGTSKCKCNDASKTFSIDASGNGSCKAKASSGGGGGGNSVTDCVNKRTTAEGKACCYLKTSDATCDEKTEKCTCTDTTKKFEIGQDGKGVCKASSGGGEGDGQGEGEGEGQGGGQGDQGGGGNATGKYTCSAHDLTLFNSYLLLCSNNTNAKNVINTAIAMCNQGEMTRNEFDSLKDLVLAAYNSCVSSNSEEPEVKKPEPQQPDEKSISSDKIKEAGKKLDDIVAGFGDANVWKDADGKFNAARLASDSIAGVVLGTAGGLITSSVMKKKQAEQGFEDLKCVVGGQSVAGWGDEFNVGIQ